MDLDVLLYKRFLMILGGILTVGTLIATIFTLVFGPGIGWGALMFVSMLISIGVFYTGWDTARKSKSLRVKRPLVQSIMKNHN